MRLAFRKTGFLDKEIDFIVEAEGKLLPIEVKAATRPRVEDARHLRIFQDEYGDLCRSGLLLHTGERVEWLNRRVLACPWWRVL